MATIRQYKNGSWQAVIRKQGHSKQSKTFALQRDAENWAKSVELEMDRGTWAPIRPADTTTLREILQRYKAEITPTKRSEIKENSALGILLDTRIAKMPIGKIEGVDIAKLRDEWLTALSPATVIKRLNTLSAVFQTAKKEWGYKSLGNPVLEIKKPPAPAGRDRRVEDEDDEDGRRIESGEIERLLAVSQSTSLRNAVTLALETGMRRGELCKLTWCMIDLKNGVAYLPGTITKNGQAREVPLSQLAIEVLQTMPRLIGDKPILGVRPDGLTQAFIRTQARARQVYEDECKAAKRKPSQTFLANLRFHDLRHEATSRLAEIFEPHELAKITGWKTLNMIMRYFHPRGVDLAQKLRAKTGIL